MALIYMPLESRAENSDRPSSQRTSSSPVGRLQLQEKEEQSTAVKGRTALSIVNIDGFSIPIRPRTTSPIRFRPPLILHALLGRSSVSTIFDRRGVADILVQSILDGSRIIAIIVQGGNESAFLVFLSLFGSNRSFQGSYRPIG